MRKGIDNGQLKLFSDEEIQQLHQAALEILAQKGIKIEHKNVLNLLDQNGCEVNFDTRITKFPRKVVEKTIARAPESFKLSARNPENDFVLDTTSSFFTAGTGTTSVLDLETEKRRKATKKDLSDAAVLSDALDQIDASWSIFTLTDDPMLGFHHLYSILTQSTKHGAIVNWYGGDLTDKLIDMIAVITGGREKLSERKLVTLYSEPVSPLTFRRENMEVLLKWTDVGLPLIWYPAQKPGATSPMTLAGTLAQAFAESLGGNAIAQLNNPGTPVILGASPLIMDMRNALNTYFSAEMILLQSATGQWGDLCHVPIFGTGGCTNSYSLDFQAGVESAVSLYGAVLGGQNWIHDLSFAGAGDLGSLGLLTLTDEIVSMIKRTVRGIRIDSESIALEVINEVPHGGDYLKETHTITHAREEIFPSQFMRRIAGDKWKDNFSVLEARKKARELVTTHETPQVSDTTKQRLIEIMNEAQCLASGKNPHQKAKN